MSKEEMKALELEAQTLTALSSFLRNEYSKLSTYGKTAVRLTWNTVLCPFKDHEESIKNGYENFFTREGAEEIEETLEEVKAEAELKDSKSFERKLEEVLDLLEKLK